METALAPIFHKMIDSKPPVPCQTCGGIDQLEKAGNRSYSQAPPDGVSIGPITWFRQRRNGRDPDDTDSHHRHHGCNRHTPISAVSRQSRSHRNRDSIRLRADSDGRRSPGRTTGHGSHSEPGIPVGSRLFCYKWQVALAIRLSKKHRPIMARI